MFLDLYLLLSKKKRLRKNHTSADLQHFWDPLYTPADLQHFLGPLPPLEAILYIPFRVTVPGDWVKEGVYKT